MGVTTNAYSVAADLRGAGDRVGPAVELVTRKSIGDVERDGKQFAPVDTGNLRNSISSTVTRTATGVAGEAGPTAEYGDYVERGTSRMPPQPYMAPALERNAPGYEAAIAQIVDRL